MRDKLIVLLLLITGIILLMYVGVCVIMPVMLSTYFGVYCLWLYLPFGLVALTYWLIIRSGDNYD